jgi:hypothetical protein
MLLKNIIYLILILFVFIISKNIIEGLLVKKYKYVEKCKLVRVEKNK